MIALSGCTASTCGSLPRHPPPPAPVDLASSLDMSGPSPNPPAAAAFFDLDKTIIAGSSALAFSRPFLRQGLITRRAVLRSGYAQLLLMVVAARTPPRWRPCGGGSPRCAPGGRSPRSARSWPRRCTRSSNLSSTPRPRRSSPNTGRTGDEVVVLSASGQEVVEPIAAMLGADRCQATRMAVAQRPLHRGDRALPLRRAQGAGRARHRRRAGLSAGALPRVLRLDHRPAIARGGRTPDGGQPGPGPAPGRRGARLAGADLRAFPSPCARGSAGHGRGGRARRTAVRSPSSAPGGTGCVRHR